MKKTFLLLLLFTLLTVFSCDNESHSVKYSVTADVKAFPARITYLNDQHEADTLFAVTLPWNFRFEAESGDRVKLTADIADQGNISFTGVDTMRLKIFIDGSVLKQAIGVIQNQSMQEVTIEAVVPD